MKFAHFADCHIGAFRDPKLRDLNMKAFNSAIENIIAEKVDFLLISGDLFNTSVPPVDSLKNTVTKLKELQKNGIMTYVVSGSHDFSPSGKTMIDVLEEAGLLHNVVKGSVVDERLRLRFIQDRKTGAKIVGMIGKRGSLEKKFYHDLDREHLEKEQGFKIFLFHTTIDEARDEKHRMMESTPISYLPKNFNYYAGGHIHKIIERKYGDAPLIYPGPIFPNSFSEIEELKSGSYVLYEDGKLTLKKINIINVFPITIDCSGKTPAAVEEELKNAIKNREFINTIVTIRLSGTLGSGKPSDIGWKEIYDLLEKKQAYVVLRNTEKLISEEFKEVSVDTKSSEEIEENLINEHLGKIDLKGVDEKEFVKALMNVLANEKQEGEKSYDFERRIIEGLKNYLE